MWRDETIEAIATKLRRLKVPDQVLAKHVERLKEIRRIKRSQIIRKKEGRNSFSNWIAIDGVIQHRISRPRGREKCNQPKEGANEND
jgi:hypothetical protein